MRRVIVPALMAIAMVAASSANASAFGLFDKFCNKGCDSCCDVEPACGCEAPAEPTCGCEAPCEPACGAEPACGCEAGCAPKAKGLLQRLFHKHSSNCCEPVCGAEPTCGCEAPCEPTCGCEAPCEPACGAEVVDECCDPCARPKLGLKGLFSKMFKKHHSDCCEPACGAEPTCGCEPTCGAEPSCGAGN